MKKYFINLLSILMIFALTLGISGCGEKDEKTAIVSFLSYSDQDFDDQFIETGIVCENENWTLKVHRIRYNKEVIIMKFIDFIKKYYIVSQRSFSYSYSYEEQKTLEKNIFQRKRYESVSLLASQRKKAIINSYIFLGISLL